MPINTVMDNLKLYNLKDAFSNTLANLINQKPHTLFELKMELSR